MVDINKDRIEGKCLSRLVRIVADAVRHYLVCQTDTGGLDAVYGSWEGVFLISIPCDVQGNR